MARETIVNSFPSPSSLGFTRKKCNHGAAKSCTHECVPVIVSRCTSFVDDFVIGRYQVANFSARGAASPVRLLQRARVRVILVLLHTSQFWSFGKVSKDTVLSRRRPESDSREVLAGVSLDSDTPSSTRFSVTSSKHSGTSRNKCPCAGTMSLLSRVNCSESRDWSPSARLLVGTSTSYCCWT